MASVDEVIAALKTLRPEQVDEVARIIRDLSQAGSGEARQNPAIPADVVDEAVRHGWPVELFTKVMGSLPDLARPVQPLEENRNDL